MSRSSNRELAQAILALTKRTSGARLSKTVAAYLSEQRRSKDLDAVMRELIRLRREQGISEVNITSAYPVPAKFKKDLVKSAKADKVIINEVIDKTVIGGVRVETSESLLDLTVRNRLQKLKQGANN